MTTSRPQLTVAETIEQFQVSRATLKRRLTAGHFPGAHKDTTGAWRIPIEVLHAGGLTPTRTWSTNDTPTAATESLDELSAQIRDLKTALDHERLLRQTAERIAETEHQRAETAHLALRMIESRPPENHQVPEPRKRWWQR